MSILTTIKEVMMLTNKDLNYLEIQLAELKTKCGRSVESLPTAIYARKSKEDLKKTSLESQIGMCKEEVDNCPLLKLIENSNGVFQDDDESGMFTSKRDGYKELLNLVKNGVVKVIIVYSRDRLHRRQSSDENLEVLINSLGGAIISVTESYPHNAAGNLSRRVMGVVSQYHAENTAELVVRTNIRVNAPQCKSCGGVANYGYSFNENRTLSINEEEAPAVRLMFKRFIEMKSYSQIIDELTNLGYKTRAGKPFKQTTILTILKNPKYKGTFFYNKSDRRKKSERVIVAKFDEVVIPNGIQRLVSDEDFELVQMRLKNRAMTSAKTPNKTADYVLTGVMFCADCGASYHGRSKVAGRMHHKYFQYVCSSVDNKTTGRNCKSKPLDKDAIELSVANVICETIRQAIENGQIIDSFENKIQNSIKREILNLENSKNAVLRKQNQIVNTMCKVTSDDVLKKLEAEFNTTKTRLKQIDDSTKTKQIELAKSKNNIKHFKEKMKSFTAEKLVQDRPVFSLLVKRLIKRITVGDEITIELL